MKTLTRSLIRAHAGPFAFAFSAITSLLFLTALAQRFQELAGRGVGPGIILELMVLSLPHVVTLAVPMGLFAATLYVFADLAESRELVGMAAGGVHPMRLVVPMALVGLVASLLMVAFNDRVLSGANARFQDRLEDVARKSPSLGVRQGTLNAVRTSDGSLRYLWAQSVGPEAEALRGVVIVDLSDPKQPDFVTSDQAALVPLPNGRDLLLRLGEGQLFSPVLDRVGVVHLAQFESARVRLPGLAAKVATGQRVGERAERELSLAVLRTRVREAREGLGPPVRYGASAADSAAQGVIVRSLGELHRRYATAFACLVFALLAPPLGIRFAHGGIGAVIGLSVAVLFFFRVGIIWGDRLTDAGTVGPIVGGWGTIGVLLLAALPLLKGMGSTASADSTPPEGEGWQTVRNALGRRLSASRSRPRLGPP